MTDFPKIQLSKPLADAQDHYDIIVVGSGYGASISASRLARAGRKVAVLERGREIRPGDYPRTMGEVMNEAQITVQQSGKVLGRTDGLYDFRMNGDMSVVLGCGLGGTSLINANVALDIDKRLMNYFDWPAIYRKNPNLLDSYYERARQGLGSNPYPEDGQKLMKLEALKQSAESMEREFYPPPINVTFADGKNDFGFEQNACTLCGDCCTGCNYNAKNTTLMNYLPDARAFGADIITGAEVSHLSKSGATWQVHIAGRDAPVTADAVVLGAGSLGSTEILLRTAAKTDLTFSDQLGKRFSGNGDVLAFGYNANLPYAMGKSDDDSDPRPALFGVGAGAHAPDSVEYQPGPTIAGIIDMRDRHRPIKEGMVIEEGILPGPLSAAWSAIFFMDDALAGNLFHFGDSAMRLEDASTIGNIVQTDPTSLTAWSYKGPISRTQTYLVMSHDSSDGTIALDNGEGRAGIVWPGAGREATYVRDNKVLEEAADGIWAEFLPNPMWGDEFGNKLVTVHPIGGCVMGDDATKGVVNGFAQVFDPAGSATDADGQGIHAGLMVCDGAIIPGALGVNPLLTISALTEHAVEAWATREGWNIDFDTRKPLPDDCFPETVDTPEDTGSGMSVAFMLMMADAALASIRKQITDGDLKGARDAIMSDYAMLKTYLGDGAKSLPSDRTVRLFMTDNTLKQDVAGVIDEFLPIMEQLQKAMADKDYGAALTILRENMGDFSPGLSFSEKMHGFLSDSGLDRDHSVSDPYEIACRDGEMADQKIIGHFRISTDSLDRMVDDPDHTAKLEGTIECPLLGGCFTLADGAEFKLFKQNADQVECWNMIYSGTMTDDTLVGNEYRFEGYKILQKRPGSSPWTDTTTLFVDIYDGGDELVAKGIMTLGLQDLATQISTVQEDISELSTVDEIKLAAEIGWAYLWGDIAKVLEDKGLRASLIKEVMVKAAAHGHPEFENLIKEHYIAQFGALFAKLVFRTYGGVLSYLQDFPQADDLARIEREKTNPPVRQLPLPAAEVHNFDGEPGKALCLTRFNGGGKGPVILAPGFGVTASSFIMTTTPVNLTEYLCDQGYDVWLFDYRGSPALKATQEPFTIDDIATKDWPAAIKQVNDATGKDVQIIAHCVGSMSLLMHLLKGATGIKSVVSSQTTLHPVTSWMNYAKADVHLASVLMHGAPKSMDGIIDKLGLPAAITDLLKNGMPTVNMAPAPTTEGTPEYMREKIIDTMMFNVPFPGEEPCQNPVCHRVFGVFGASYVHDQLNEDTHNALRDVFGEVSSTPFLQLAAIMRAGRAIDADGHDSYMDTPESITQPVDFIAGSRNQIFYPETSLRTYNWLLKNHPDGGDGQFTRQVFPTYAHMDLFIGKTAEQDIFPTLLECLENRAG
jgi:choline dehydrogenase-like flavoprotein